MRRILRNESGYTLVEVLISATVLVVGMAFLFGAFFKSSENLTYLSDRFHAKGVANNLMAQAEGHLEAQGNLKQFEMKGETRFQKRIFDHQMTARPLALGLGFYEVEVHVSWKDSQVRHFTRTGYILRS